MIRLVHADISLMDAALTGDDALAAALGVDVVPGWATFTEALGPARDAIANRSPESPWGTLLFVAEEPPKLAEDPPEQPPELAEQPPELAEQPPELVGWGGFKGPPRDGVVELGYEIAAARRGRGLATAAVEAMVAEAFDDPAVSGLIAHTLPVRNASNRVLEKVGFRFDGEVEEDGEPIWRFRLARPAAPGGLS